MLLTIQVNDAIALEPLTDSHAGPLLQLVNSNREYLRQWLPWVDHMQTVDDFKSYINRCKKQEDEGTDYSYVIVSGSAVVGRIGIHYIAKQNKFGAIGYWIGEEFTGKGIMTKACRALIEVCFIHLQLNRIEIKCATGNYKSAAIAERLNFTKEGVMRQAEWVNGHYVDLNLYALLKDDWQPKDN